MVVALLSINLYLPMSQSLKDKRMILRGVKDRAGKFNVSVAEIDHHDLWQRATVTGPGLKKFGDERLLKDTPAIHGMIFKVQHLLETQTVKEEPKPSKRRKTRSIRVRDAARFGLICLLQFQNRIAPLARRFKAFKSFNSITSRSG